MATVAAAELTAQTYSLKEARVYIQNLISQPLVKIAGLILTNCLLFTAAYDHLNASRILEDPILNRYELLKIYLATNFLGLAGHAIITGKVRDMYHNIIGTILEKTSGYTTTKPKLL